MELDGWLNFIIMATQAVCVSNGMHIILTITPHYPKWF